jgi:hypothetical protein
MRIYLLVAACLFVSACEPSGPEGPGYHRTEPEYDDTGRLTRLLYDGDGDGKVDTWAYMNGTRIVRAEVDENGDGTVDRWEYYRDGPSGSAAPGLPPAIAPDKMIERIERAKRLDGKISRTEYFENGELTRVEEDTDGNGVIDKWETYTGGSLSIMALDTQGRGKPDRRLIYKPDGSFDRIEQDPAAPPDFKTVKP